jgi:hypothetical protein|tara:strand:- start:20 stop:148 length:129 start_codon:yes stop_codon:yes gene_type:complete
MDLCDPIMIADYLLELIIIPKDDEDFSRRLVERKVDIVNNSF